MASQDSASSADESDLPSNLGHLFQKKTFHKPVYCHHCTEMLWGLIGQGYLCEVCNFVVHERCLKRVVTACSSIAPFLVKHPVAHCWSESTHFKRKFCDLCRKRLEENGSQHGPSLRCEICEYYIHLECQEFVVSDCKLCATYVPQKDREPRAQYHHWREGNLPTNAKCLVCKKTCWSGECLASLRCQWCGATAHGGCAKQLPPECSFGCLRDIMLPPFCLTVPRLDVPMEIRYRFQNKTNIPARIVSDEASSGDARYEEDDRKGNKEKDDEVFRVFDGDETLQSNLPRFVRVPKNANTKQLLEASLRAYYISDDIANYYLSEAAEPQSMLDPEQGARAQLKESRRPSVLLRYQPPNPETGVIKVYPGNLSNFVQVSCLHKTIAVNTDTTSMEVVEAALQSYNYSHDPIEMAKFSLVEVALDGGVRERELAADETPFASLRKRHEKSLRAQNVSRLYLRHSEDPHGTNIAIYIGSLPTGLSQLQYQHILLEIIGPENKWSRFDVIYYEYGALVLIFADAIRATKAFNLLRSATYDDKSLLALVLPNIQAHMIPEHVTPLLVLVNVKSGGQQGMDLIRSFRKLLNPHQVFDLMNGGPLPGLYVFRNIPYFKIMVCGGDGTVGWALSCLDNVGQDAQCQTPPMAIVPLGTGNDLARVLRWGPGYTGTEDPLNILRDIIEAEEIQLDRWTVIFHPDEKETNENKVALQNLTKSANTNEDTSSIYVMNNYFGIGIDADLCLDFHHEREENPDKFNSRLRNKGIYFKIGLRKMLASGRGYSDLRRHVRVEVDNKLIELPPVEGIIILNILSWASGANPWGPEREEKFEKPTHYDGNLEVVGVTGVVHMGQIHSGMRSGIRIAQGGHLRITLLKELPVQVDGEPWVQQAGQVVVLRSALKATMLKKTKNKIRRRNTEPNIFFPAETSVGLPSEGTSGPA